MHISKDYREVLKELFIAAEELKNYIYKNLVLDSEKLENKLNTYKEANRKVEEFDKNLRFED